MQERKIISFNIITTVIIYIVAAVLLLIINPVLCYIFLGISIIHLIWAYVIGNKLKKFKDEGLFKKSNQ